MDKVKLISSKDEKGFENEINEFITNKSIIDIKFTTTDHPRFSALILYKYKDSNEVNEDDEVGVYF